MLRWMAEYPLSAMAIAIPDSVTVSMSEEIAGILERSQSTETEVSVSRGNTFEYNVANDMSSKVSAIRTVGRREELVCRK